MRPTKLSTHPPLADTTGNAHGRISISKQPPFASSIAATLGPLPPKGRRSSVSMRACSMQQPHSHASKQRQRTLKSP